MTLTLQEVFDQAKQDGYAVPLDTKDYEARLVYGAKIKRDRITGEIVIMNTSVGADNYVPVTADILEIFKQDGWRSGAYALYLHNLRGKIESSNDAIVREVQGKNRESVINLLARKRMNQIKLYHIKSNQFYGND